MTEAPITNQRDKLVIAGLIVLGVGCLAGIAFSEQGPQLVTPLSMVISALGVMFKGMPSSPAANTIETTTTETKSN